MSNRPQTAFVLSGGAALGIDHAAAARPIERLLGPRGFQVDCQECFDLVNEYAELELDGIEAGTLIPGQRTHLDGCPACNEDYESLRALLTELAADRD